MKIESNFLVTSLDDHNLIIGFLYSQLNNAFEMLLTNMEMSNSNLYIFHIYYRIINPYDLLVHEYGCTGHYVL